MFVRRLSPAPVHVTSWLEPAAQPRPHDGQEHQRKTFLVEIIELFLYFFTVNYTVVFFSVKHIELFDVRNALYNKKLPCLVVFLSFVCLFILAFVLAFVRSFFLSFFLPSFLPSFLPFFLPLFLAWVNKPFGSKMAAPQLSTSHHVCT